MMSGSTLVLQVDWSSLSTIDSLFLWQGRLLLEVFGDRIEHELGCTPRFIVSECLGGASAGLDQHIELLHQHPRTDLIPRPQNNACALSDESVSKSFSTTKLQAKMYLRCANKLSCPSDPTSLLATVGVMPMVPSILNEVLYLKYGRVSLCKQMSSRCLCVDYVRDQHLQIAIPAEAAYRPVSHGDQLCAQNMARTLYLLGSS